MTPVSVKTGSRVEARSITLIIPKTYLISTFGLASIFVPYGDSLFITLKSADFLFILSSVFTATFARSIAMNFLNSNSKDHGFQFVKVMAYHSSTFGSTWVAIFVSILSTHQMWCFVFTVAAFTSIMTFWLLGYTEEKWLLNQPGNPQ